MYNKLLGTFFVLMLALVGAARAQTGQPDRALVYSPNFGGSSREYESAVAKCFTAEGYEVECLDAAALCDAARLSQEKGTVLVLPDAGRLPLGSIGPVQDFARRGGRLVALNTPAWREVLVQGGGGWMAVSDFRREYAEKAAKRIVVDWKAEDLAQWSRAFRSADLQGRYAVVEGSTPDQPVMRADVKRLDGWDSLLKKFDASPFTSQDELVIFSARSVHGATHLALEWEERDGSRWIATVALSKEWTQYALTPEDFLFWESVPERKDTRFNPLNVGRLGITLAFTHTGYADRELQYEVGPLHVATLDPKYRDAFRSYTVPPMETLCPGYKFFEPGEVASLGLSGFAGSGGVRLPKGMLRAMHPRPQAHGFDKKRGWVWEPLVVAKSAAGELRGTVGAMISHAEGPLKGGMWVSIGIGDPSWYLSEEGTKLLKSVAKRLKTPVVVLDAGADRYACFEGQAVRLGMTVGNLDSQAGSGIEGVVRVKCENKTVHEAALSLQAAAGQTGCAEQTWMPEDDRAVLYTVETSICSNGEVLEQGTHDLHLWRPKAERRSVVTDGGEFRLDGRRWRPHGVNYMPSSGIACEDQRYFEQWLSPQSYDPEVVQRDLERCASLGFNALSVFLYKDFTEAQNLIDLLIRMDRLGMKANVSLRPGTPMEAPPTVACGMIEALRLAENDTVFAYDLAWEPQFRPMERDPFNAAWVAWIQERFGSLENAERLWGFAIPRDAEGRPANFTEEMIGREGPWSPYVAAYRRFLDTLLYEKYSIARDMVREVDPNHHVSFRMSMASDPTDTQTNTIVYDFAYLAGAVDVLEPEAYGRIGDWDRVKPGWFTREYARWANPGIPMIWAEAGVHTWDMASMSTPADKLDFQAQFYQDFYRMLRESGADGIFWWWYPGGFRTNENSDYGIINPDGTDRPVSEVIRREGTVYTQAPSLAPVTDRLLFDRDKYTNGLSGVYKELGGAFWDIIDKGGTPGLRTEGTGSDSSTCALTGVGNLAGPGVYPCKFLDAFFDRVEVKTERGDWVRAERGHAVGVGSTSPVEARITLTNLGEATLLCGADAGGGPGAVFVTARGIAHVESPLPRSLKRFERATVGIVLSERPLSGPQEVELGMAASQRVSFGPRYTLQLTP